MTILIVDDEQIARMLLNRVLLEISEFAIVEAEGGLDAWQKLEAGLRPDLCILDLVMPQMDGIALLQKMRRHACFMNTKVILCTVVNERFRKNEALSLDIAGYVVKPFNVKMLRHEVDRVLRNNTGGVSRRSRPG